MQRCNRCNVARLRWPISISKTGMATVETAVVIRGVAIRIEFREFSRERKSNNNNFQIFISFVLKLVDFRCNSFIVLLHYCDYDD